MKKQLAVVAAVVALGFSGTQLVSATTVEQDPTRASKTPLEISPLCKSDNKAFWNVHNKDSNNVLITFKVNSQVGTYEAPAGNTKFDTPYTMSDNNTTEFIYTAEDKSTSTGYQIDSVTRNASNEECKDKPAVTPPKEDKTEEVVEKVEEVKETPKTETAPVKTETPAPVVTIPEEVPTFQGK